MTIAACMSSFSGHLLFYHVVDCIMVKKLENNQRQENILLNMRKKLTYQGSNSCIMLSNRMTANKRELNPTSQARVSITNVNKLCKPPGFHIVERMSVFTPASAMLIYASFRHVILVSQSNFGKCHVTV